MQPFMLSSASVLVAAVLHDSQTGGQTTTWQWTAPSGLSQLAEILVVAGEEGAISCLMIHCYAWPHQEPLPLHQLSSFPVLFLLGFCTFQVVVVVLAAPVREVVLVELSTRPTTQSRMAHPTPLSLAKEGQRQAAMMMV
jgi:hypothetical protein